MKNLPPGVWLSLYDLPGETSETDLIEAILARTGILLDSAQLDIKPHHDVACAIVSFNHVQITAFLNWACEGGEIHGKAFKWRVPYNKRAA